MKPSQEGPIHKPHGDQIQVGWLGQNDGKFYDWSNDHSEMKANNPGGYSPVYIDRGD